MGIYINPGNEGFRQIRKAEYVDKSGMIEYINSTLETMNKMTCVTRPRRFGKSYAARMLAAYYDKTCDSRELFDDLKISNSDSYEMYLNHYDVIYLDVTRFTGTDIDRKTIVKYIQKTIIDEMRSTYPYCIRDDVEYLPDALFYVTEKTGGKFVFIIDEWDALFREAKADTKVQREYVNLLRGLFKGGIATDKTIAAAYITGILPIKKYGTESAMTDFQEFTMVDPAFVAEYVGFTEDEVKMLCTKHQMDFESMKQWYDGYHLERVESVYSPNSVMQAIRRKSFANYWTQTESFESLKDYITMNLDGLKDAITEMLGGGRCEIEPLSFQNDLVSFEYKDDVLTYFVHLGYLAYDRKTSEVYIPNLEVADSFRMAVREDNWGVVAKAISNANKLLNETINKNADAVAKALDDIHSSTSSVLQYNDENSLSCALTIAYYTARKEYLIIREFPSGKGFADLAFVPRKNTDKPAMIIELKYNKDADTAIRQIKERRYAGELKEYAGTGGLLLVGVNYDKKAKEHTCVIEEG